MSAVAGQLTIGPLAAARLQTLTACSVARDEPRPPRAGPLSARDAILFAVAAALIALMIAAIGQTMPRTSADAVSVTPEEVFVVNPDDKEPFIVCTERAGSRQCAYLDVIPTEP